MRMRVLAMVVGSLALSASLASAQVLGPGDSSRSIVVGATTRTYLLHVPAKYTGTTAVPLVVDIHGLGSNASQQRGISGMVAVADREGFVIDPEGVTNRWNAGICCGNPDMDDVAFIRELVAAISADGNIDASRVYATGLSNGGAMSQRLACDAADLFAASAPLAFPIPFEPLSGCQPARAMPVLTFMGLTDVLVRYDGPAFPSAARAPSTTGATSTGCGTGAPEARDRHGRELLRHRHELRAPGVQVGLCSITSTSGAPYAGHILYINADFAIAPLAYDFLSQFSLPAPGPALPAPWAAGLVTALRHPVAAQRGNGCSRRHRYVERVERHRHQRVEAQTARAPRGPLAEAARRRATGRAAGRGSRAVCATS